MPFNDQKSAKSADTAEHDLAVLESKDCPQCGGNGMVPVYAPQHNGTGLCRQFDETPFATVVGAHCRCNLGQWIRSRNKRDIWERVPKVQDILDGRSRWMLEDPTEDDAPLTSRRERRES